MRGRFLHDGVEQAGLDFEPLLAPPAEFVIEEVTEQPRIGRVFVERAGRVFAVAREVGMEDVGERGTRNALGLADRVLIAQMRESFSEGQEMDVGGAATVKAWRSAGGNEVEAPLLQPGKGLLRPRLLTRILLAILLAIRRVAERFAVVPLEPDMINAQREKAATGGIDRGPGLSVLFHVEEAGFLAVDARKEARRTIRRKGFGNRR